MSAGKGKTKVSLEINLEQEKTKRIETDKIHDYSHCVTL